MDHKPAKQLLQEQIRKVRTYVRQLEKRLDDTQKLTDEEEQDILESLSLLARTADTLKRWDSVERDRLLTVKPE